MNQNPSAVKISIAILTDEELDVLIANGHVNTDDILTTNCASCGVKGNYKPDGTIEMMEKFPDAELVFMCRRCMEPTRGTAQMAITAQSLDQMEEAYQRLPEEKRQVFVLALAAKVMDGPIYFPEDVQRDHVLLGRVAEVTFEGMKESVEIMNGNPLTEMIATRFMSKLGDLVENKDYKGFFEVYHEFFHNKMGVLASAAQYLRKEDKDA